MTRDDKVLVRNIIIFCIIFSIFFTIYRIVTLLDKQKAGESADNTTITKVVDNESSSIIIDNVSIDNNSDNNTLASDNKVEEVVIDNTTSILINKPDVPKGVASPFDDLDNLLYEAILKGSLEETRRYIDMGANINAVDTLGNTILLRVSDMADTSQDQLNSIRYLLIKGANPNLANREGDTPLINHFAKNLFNEKLLNLLFEYDVNPNKQNSLGYTPLNYAIYNGVDKVKYLIDHGANVNSKNLRNETPLYFATKDNVGIPVIDLLLKSGADRNIYNEDGISPLSIAKTSNNKELYKVYGLTQEEVDKDNSMQYLRDLLANNRGKPAIDKIEKAVLEKDINRSIPLTNGTNVNGRFIGEEPTPLILALYFGYDDIAKALIESGADVNKTEQYPKLSPLIVATSLDNIDMMKYLMDKGADIHYASMVTDDTAIHSANSREAAELLLKAGADPNISNNAACASPLQKAVMYNNYDLAEILINYGADTNHIDCGESKPVLVYAIDNNNVDMVKLLLDNGAGVNTEADIELTKTIPEYAREKGNQEIIALIDAKDINKKAEEKTVIEDVTNNAPQVADNKTTDNIQADNETIPSTPKVEKPVVEKPVDKKPAGNNPLLTGNIIDNKTSSQPKSNTPKISDNATMNKQINEVYKSIQNKMLDTMRGGNTSNEEDIIMGTQPKLPAGSEIDNIMNGLLKEMENNNQ